MVVQVGVMELPVTEDPDDIQTYMNGEHLSGGLWTALTRASNHDHSGGLSGVQLGATSIPDGSITTAKLDPAVLLPYALVDGSKPFTGQVSLNADTLVRDTLYFGAKPAGVADASLKRTAAGALRVDTHLGVGVNPSAWGGTYRGLQVGQRGAVWADSTGPGFWLSENTHFDGTDRRALISASASQVTLSNGGLSVATAPLVAAGASQTFTTRATINSLGQFILNADGANEALLSLVTAGTGNANIVFTNNGAQRYGFFAGTAGLAFYDYPKALNRMSVSPTGTLTLTPDVGQAGLVVTPVSGNAVIQGTHLTVQATAAGANLTLAAANGLVIPPGDNTTTLGYASGFRWVSVAAVAGTIQTSSAAVKEGITPLSQSECYEAAKQVVWFDFRYAPPAFTAPEPPPDIAYDAADDNETKAEKKAARDEAEAQAKAAHLKMVAETAPARHQRGFVFGGAEAKDEAGGALPPVPDLFGLSDRESTTPQADLATLGCAMQEVIRHLEDARARIAALEGAAA